MSRVYTETTQLPNPALVPLLPLCAHVHTHTLYSLASIPIFWGILVEGSITDLAGVTTPEIQLPLP